MPVRAQVSAQADLERKEAVLIKIMAIAKARLTFNMRYANYCHSCTDDEYKELTINFVIPTYVDVDHVKAVTFPCYKNKQSAEDFFYRSGKNYTTVIIAIKKILAQILAAKTDLSQKACADVQKKVDWLLYSLSLSYNQIHIDFDVTSKKLVALFRSTGPTHANKKSILKYIEAWKDVAAPELKPMEEMVKPLYPMASDNGLRTLQIVDKIFEITSAEVHTDAGAENRNHAAISYMKGLQRTLNNKVKKCKALLEFVQNNPYSNIRDSVNETIIMILDDAEGKAALEFTSTDNNAQDFDYSVRHAVNFYTSIEFCDAVYTALREIVAQCAKTAQEDRERSAELEKQQAALATETAALQLEQKAAQQEELDRIEQAKQESIKEQNAAASAERHNWRTAKQDLYKRIEAEKAASSVLEEDEEEEAGSTLAQNSRSLNKNNYETLEAIFREEHNTITYAQVKLLIKSLGGDVTAGGGSSRKITLKNVDTFTLEPTGNITVAGLHEPHRPGHNEHTLIKPIVQDIKGALVNAGFTPQTCKIQNEAVASPTLK